MDVWAGHGRVGRAWTCGQGMDVWAGHGRVGRAWTCGHETTTEHGSVHYKNNNLDTSITL